MTKTTTYLAPRLDEICVGVECGFASSGSFSWDDPNEELENWD